jgi:glycosyltransferase involved in cell wall biosynthesis
MNYHQVLVSKELGGAGLIGLELASALRDRRSNSHLWIPEEGPAAARAEAMGLSWRRFDAAKAFSSSRLTALGCNWKLGRLLRAHQPGLVHVHSPSLYGAVSLGLNLSKLKTIAHVQIEEEEGTLRWAFQRPPNVIITCAQFLVPHVRGALAAEYQDRQRIIAVPNAIDTEVFKPGNKLRSKQCLGIDPNVTLILMAANLAPHKGQETALHAAAILKQRGFHTQFWFAGVERGGNLDYTKRLRRLVGELGISDQVRFLGHREDIPELLRAADFFVLPSTAEGLPLSILEAQASGTPVLAAPTAGIPEIVIDGETGILVDANDAAGYAHHITSLLCKRTEYFRLSERGRELVAREHSWKRYVSKMWDIYQQLAT